MGGLAWRAAWPRRAAGCNALRGSTVSRVVGGGGGGRPWVGLCCKRDEFPRWLSFFLGPRLCQKGSLVPLALCCCWVIATHAQVVLLLQDAAAYRELRKFPPRMPLGRY